MGQLTSVRDTVQVACDGRYLYLPVKAGALIYQGAMVALDSQGHAVPANKTAGLKAAGRAEETADNRTGADGEIMINVLRGVFIWDNSAANALTEADVLGPCYMEDDQTVGSLADGSSPAGIVVHVTDAGVAVQTALI
ncbi:hypothetical protein [Hungatella effluvii]|uniref:hypothetical protein n=1 Tax=Hungatella effluvii TaxID=1096246 RepID=UPI0022E421F1|nr:hypothetical protein [Hungatella effluvii]